MPYVVTSPITHLGKSYAVGDPIELHTEHVYQLVMRGCVKEVPPPVPVDCGGCAPPAFVEAEAKTATKPLPPPGRMLKGAF